MEKKIIIEFVEDGKIRKFEGNSCTLNSILKGTPAMVFSGYFNEAGCCIEGGERSWLTNWSVREHGPFNNYFVKDPEGEERFVPGFHPSETERGGRHFVLCLITLFKSWRDFDLRANNIMKREWRYSISGDVLKPNK